MDYVKKNTICLDVDNLFYKKKVIPLYYEYSIKY